MKKMSRILSTLIKLGHINPDDFYSITINGHALYLQGKYNPQVVVKAQEHGAIMSIDGNGYIVLSIGYISISLTN